MTSCQWSRERRLELLLGGEHDRGLLGNQLEERAEAVDRQDVRDVRPLVALLGRRQLGELAVLGVELRGGSDLHASASPSERWVKVENQRSDSTSSPNSSARTARSSVAG